MKDYEDILYLPHPKLKRHVPMPQAARAAQFGAFRALTGHEAAIEETARLTENVPYFSEQVIGLLNLKFSLLKEHLEEHPLVTVTYFRADEKKSGGAYITVSDRVKKLDDFEKKLVFYDKGEISIESVSELSGDLFKEMESLLS